MAIQGNGEIRLSQLQDEFGGTNPTQMSEYYRGASNGYVPDSSFNTDIPTSGQNRLQNYYSSQKEVPVPLRLLGNLNIGVTPAAVDANVAFQFGGSVQAVSIWPISEWSVYDNNVPYIGYAHTPGNVSDNNRIILWGLSSFTFAQQYAAGLNGDTIQELVVNGTPASSYVARGGWIAGQAYNPPDYTPYCALNASGSISVPGSLYGFIYIGNGP